MALARKKNLIAPCGLYCGTCAFFHESEIRKTVLHLKELLDGFDYIAKIYEKNDPVLKDYSKFMDILDYLGAQKCLGCRFGGSKDSPHGAACMPDTCTMILCSSDKELDFCYQCSDFPCEIVPFIMKRSKNEGLIEIWLRKNKEMKKIGLDKYLKKKISEPRYKLDKPVLEKKGEKRH